jgi:hypothetical protein
MKRHRVDVEHVNWLKQQLRDINCLDFNEIDFYEDDKKLDIDPKKLGEWRFIGMNNSDFIDTKFYKYGMVEYHDYKELK